ncbi:hypothetical protein T10_4838 [Trichinella papuae]|uniref:Uncharacterized protein n=1 Tax=Trichinella papuae TaxID=268474 RepID=A0A0V1N8N5_9BILA|nr:hypothetical protein T10_4838 [Trichinella papuae]
MEEAFSKSFHVPVCTVAFHSNCFIRTFKSLNFLNVLTDWQTVLSSFLHVKKCVRLCQKLFAFLVTSDELVMIAKTRSGNFKMLASEDFSNFNINVSPL